MRNKLSLEPNNQQSLQQKQLLIIGGAITVFLAVALALVSTVSSSVEVSGVINAYSPVTYVGSNHTVVEDVNYYQVGDKVVLIQMKGAIIDESESSSYGDVVDFGDAGNYEIKTIKSISGDTLFFKYLFCHAYDPAHSVQCVRVAYYEQDVEINNTLSADPWDGRKGGILALESTKKIYMGADIDVSGLGFRGGDRNGRAVQGGATYHCDFNSGKGGIKGEGIIEITQAACRGKLANGGGGGNDHNGGGGGGGNYGIGGIGGHGWKSGGPNYLSDLDKGGVGGLSLQTVYDRGIPKLFLGGGGGGGHQNNGASIPASSGGGIVILISEELVMDEYATIYANSPDAQDHYVNDGAGGGGAGGSVLLDIQTLVQAEKLTIDVSGGDGASIYTSAQHGPGGGGGGGYINTSSTLPSGVSMSLEGGEPGLFISNDGNNPHRNTSHGATAGEDGEVINTLVIQKCSDPPVLDLDNTSSGSDFEATMYTYNPEVRIANLAQIEVTDSDDVTMDLAHISLLNPSDSAEEELVLNMDRDSLAAAGIQIQMDSINHSIDLIGQASIEAYKQILNQVFYRNNKENPSEGTRMIEISVNDGGANSNSSMSFIQISYEIFPVEWLWLKADQRSDHVLVSWATASELQSDVFQVERSLDGVLYDRLGEVSAVGTTQEVSVYDFADRTIPGNVSGNVLYRLKQIDQDGSFEYSKLMEVSLDPDLSSQKIEQELYFNVFPNPAETFVNISYGESRQVRKSWLEVRNTSGQLFLRKEIEVGSEIRSMKIDLPGWEKGIYLVSIIGGNKNPHKKLVIK